MIQIVWTSNIDNIILLLIRLSIRSCENFNTLFFSQDSIWETLSQIVTGVLWNRNCLIVGESKNLFVLVHLRKTYLRKWLFNLLQALNRWLNEIFSVSMMLWSGLIQNATALAQPSYAWDIVSYVPKCLSCKDIIYEVKQDCINQWFQIIQYDSYL